MGSWEYLDFDLEIRPGSGLDYPLIARFERHHVNEILRFPFDENALEIHRLKLQLALQQIALNRAAQVHRRLPSQLEQPILEFGQALFEALFVGAVGQLYQDTFRQARRQRKGVRLCLHMQAPDLASLPWEYLYNPDEGEYLCLSNKTPLVRYVTSSTPIQPLRVTPPLRILVMIASPRDQESLDVAREQQQMAQVLAPLQGYIELVFMEGHTRCALQRKMLEGPWHVFHFIGHAIFDARRTEGVLAMETPAGTTHLVSASDLRTLLADQWELRLVILNACQGAFGSSTDLFSSTAATLVRAGIPAVLAMQADISDTAAQEFTHTFYEMLGLGVPIDAAVAEARKAMRGEITQTLEWGTPVLYLNAPNGLLFDLTNTSSPSPIDQEQTAKELSKNPGQWLQEGQTYHKAAQYPQALTAFEQALELDSTSLVAYSWKAVTLGKLNRHEDALTAYEQAAQLHPNDAMTHYNKGITLLHLKRYEDAVAAFDQAIQLDPMNVVFYIDKASALRHLQHFQAACSVYDEAIQLKPEEALYYRYKAEILCELKRYDEALVAFDQALQRNPNDTSAKKNRETALGLLNDQRRQETDKSTASLTDNATAPSKRGSRKRAPADVVTNRLDVSHIASEDLSRGAITRSTPARHKETGSGIVLLGAPGSGKGTQAEILSTALGRPYIVSKDLLRRVIELRTPAGQQAQRYYDHDKQVPDEIMVAMFLERFAEPDCVKGFLLYGFPRTIAQAQALEEELASFGGNVEQVIYLKADPNVLTKRLANRYICRAQQHRYNLITHPPKQPGICDIDGSPLFQPSDDNEEAVRQGLEIFYNETIKLLDYYGGKGKVKEIDAEQPIVAVTAAIQRAIGL